MRNWAIAAILPVCSALSACGDNSISASPAAAGAPPRGIFISASDCAAANKISLEECGRAIDRAVTTYLRQAPSYRSLRSCESAAGANRCTRDVDGHYRAQLQAFLVTMSKPAHAEALFPPTHKGTIGFKSAQGTVQAFTDDYTISASAQAIASDNNRLADKD